MSEKKEKPVSTAKSTKTTAGTGKKSVKKNNVSLNASTGEKKKTATKTKTTSTRSKKTGTSTKKSSPSNKTKSSSTASKPQSTKRVIKANKGTEESKVKYTITPQIDKNAEVVATPVASTPKETVQASSNKETSTPVVSTSNVSKKVESSTQGKKATPKKDVSLFDNVKKDFSSLAKNMQAPKKSTSTKKKKKWKIWQIVLIVIVSIGLLGGLCGLLWFNSLLKGCPDLDLRKKEEYSTASIIYDAKGNYIAEYGTNENVKYATIDEIPDKLKDAFVAIEDQRFYTHNGIDIKRLTGAVIGQITGNSDYGASTITQQLIKNEFLSSEVSYERKAQEIHLAMELEKKMSKDEILEWYLNIIFLGDSNYGVKVAAEDYFGKELNQLTLRECATIAGLVQSPNIYNPRINSNNGTMNITDKRTNNVLYAMYNTGKITEAEYNAALNDTINVLPSSKRYELYDYPTYVEYAVEDVAKHLIQQSGETVDDASLNDMKRFIRGAGYSIYTYFDKDIQDITQDAITNFTLYPYTKNGDPVESSAVIMDHSTGGVVAMVGGKEEPTSPEGFNRATDSTQGVGSSIKPLSVYAPAIETGDYPGTTVMDIQEDIQGYGVDNSYPNGDYTNEAITMRKALELSHNIPAAKFLLEHVGLERGFDFMVEEGFDPDHLSETAAGLALGATDVTTLEMTGAYATLANGGVYIEPHAYSKVIDRFNDVMLDEKDSVETHRVFSESTAWLTTDMLRTNVVGGLGVRARLSNMTACGKTGTHEHNVISFGGYTHYYTSFVRISADTYTEMANSSSYYQAAPLWKSYMDPIHADLEDVDIQSKTAEELGIKQYHICTNSGMLAQEWCPSTYEWAAPSNAPTEYCTGHTYAPAPEEWGDSEGGEEGWINYDNGWWDEYGEYHPY